MSQTLGEKLRQAREARGISISEVADQTRISALYLKSIEADDYKPLPGGIFNKGFVKSYAKFIGIDEQEALQEYAALLNQQNIPIDHEPKSYRSEVLTDDNTSSTGLKTIVFAVVILGLMAAGILGVKNYLDKNPSDVAVNNTNLAVNVNSSNIAPIASPTPNTASVGVPAMNDLKVEVKTTSEPVYINSLADGKKASTLMTADKPLEFTPKENLRIGFAKTLASNVQLTVNGKSIQLPATPANPKRNVIEVEITKDNLAQVWQTGKVGFDAAPAPQ